MKQILDELSRSLKEYRILPALTRQKGKPEDVSLRTPLCRFREDFIHLNIPFISAAMHAVTGVEMATALSALGGVGVLPLLSSIEDQCERVRAVKQYKAGFQTNLTTFSPDQNIHELKTAMKETASSTFPVTDNGLFHGKLLGVITDKDFDPRFDLSLTIKERMKTDIQVGIDTQDLKEANRLMIQYGRGFLPIVSKEHTLKAVVYKKDLDRHIEHPEATVDARKRHIVGAAISTYNQDRDRIRALEQSEVDFLVIDASDGFSEFQKDTLHWIKKHFDLPTIAGNAVTSDAFQMLVEWGADAVKIGMGIGSGCTTQLVRATGRGQATAITEIAAARDMHHQKSGIYIPLIADGGILSPADIAVALALGADSVMMGNFFARFAESPGRLLRVNGERVKEYWMEASSKARNIRRYYQTEETFFEEGISGHVPFKGSIYDAVPLARQKLKAALSTVGASTMDEFHHTAVLERQSVSALQDGHIHNMQRIQ